MLAGLDQVIGAVAESFQRRWLAFDDVEKYLSGSTYLRSRVRHNNQTDWL
ncbi:hypothetical protein SAMN05444158_6079 [Bradyrhizobium canariense]|uniref:Uncharacterized protein n=1 Tax=Bradyrhizobium canariense TaxID=255045 RepID=A0A1H2ADW3_9BRAD|nr:hypothetical protein SAMN05444158_6079 [Bradyrhizobium canariense]